MPLQATISGAPVEGDTLTASILDLAPAPQTRFFEGYPWRFIFTDLDCVTTAFASAGLTRARKYVRMLGQPSVIEVQVDPSDPRVHDLAADLYPRVAPSKRLLFGFRREGGSPPWVCRAAGICMTVEDEGDPDVAVSHITAYDPRKLLEARPLMDLAGLLPDPDGGYFIAARGDQIITTALETTIANEGPVHIDAGVAHGGTGFWAGTIEQTAPVNFTFQRGTSVADVWNQVEQSGNCDVILTPIYDPKFRPGYTHDLSVYKLAGVERPNAVFGWDELNRALATIDRVHDGTPGSFFNKVQYFAGTGGVPIPALGPKVNAPSVTDFGSYWQMQFFPAQTDSDPLGSAVYAIAVQALELAKQGKRTLTLSPIPERGPIPLDHYDIGDRVPVHASRNIRAASNGWQRVQSIPFDISDDGIEHIAGLLVSPDWAAPPPSQAQSTILRSLAAQPRNDIVRAQPPQAIVPFTGPPRAPIFDQTVVSITLAAAPRPPRVTRSVTP